MLLSNIPRYSRVKSKGLEFNFYFIDDTHAICETDDNKNFSLDLDTDVEFICSMKEYDINNLNNL